MYRGIERSNVIIIMLVRRARKHQPTPTTYLLIALAALISVCRCMRAGAGWSMLSKVSVQGVWKVVLMLWVGKEGTDSFLP